MASYIERRKFLATLGVAAAWPLAARAQQAAAKIPRIGFQGNSTAELEANLVGPFRDGLRALGYEEGRSIAIEYRWAEGQYDRLPALAADLVGRKVDLIAASGGDLAARAARHHQHACREPDILQTSALQRGDRLCTGRADRREPDCIGRSQGFARQQSAGVHRPCESEPGEDAIRLGRSGLLGPSRLCGAQCSDRG
jgi:hypothetical protein